MSNEERYINALRLMTDSNQQLLSSVQMQHDEMMRSVEELANLLANKETTVSSLLDWTVDVMIPRMTRITNSKASAQIECAQRLREVRSLVTSAFREAASASK